MKQLSLFSQVIILSSVKVGRELKYLVLDNGREYWTNQLYIEKYLPELMKQLTNLTNRV